MNQASARVRPVPERERSSAAGKNCIAGGKDLTVAAVEDGKVAAESIHRALMGSAA